MIVQPFIELFAMPFFTAGLFFLSVFCLLLLFPTHAVPLFDQGAALLGSCSFFTCNRASAQNFCVRSG